MATYKLPARFYNDRLDRELFDGVEVKANKSYVWLTLTDSEKASYLSDAEYYAKGYPDDAPKGIILSARATVRALTN